MIPLSMVNPGQKVQIVQIRGGRGFVSKLANMGFYPGVIIEVVSNRNGPLIIARDEIRLGLGYGMAHRIFVRPLN
ncbi:ferrous iron transport protein A [Candidatus Aerophobetes bacterium]|nr:ferrous iron transport protein A [Candidatus Aerophobetes bacterium]